MRTPGPALLPLAGAVAALLGVAAMSGRDARGSDPRSRPPALAERGYFFVGGRYFESGDDTYMDRQMYVEYEIPEGRSHPWPLVLIHGGMQLGTNFTGTPDGRQGWAESFVRAGYAVYVVDQPGRGRSRYDVARYGAPTRIPVRQVEEIFTATEQFDPQPGRLRGWPQARKHSQWPGTGRAGDPVFDQFYASQAVSIPDGGLMERLNRDAGAALLDRIGPAVLLTHSQSGLYGWQIADARPGLVKAVVAVEPNGPPFENAPLPWSNGRPARRWGITDTPIAYDPPLAAPEDLAGALEPKSDAADLVPCRLQRDPARRLTNLLRTPVLVLTGEASYHAGYDHCTARYLRQAGVDATHLRLEQVGVHGNGHMMMVEKNNAESAALVTRWLHERGL
jgi:pimeloyl-ACP methyl ester carboxylesterase